MSISQTESGLSSGDYNALLAATANIPAQFTVYRQNPSFDNYLGRISRTIATPFSIAADSTTLVRAYIDQATGTLYTEAYVSGAWVSPVSIGVSQYLGIAPKVLKNGSTWEVYSMNSLGYVYRATSSDGLTWGSHTVYSSVNFVTPAFFGVVSGTIPLLYVATVNVDGTYTIVVADTTTQYSTDITWPNTIYEIDVIDFTAKADDTTGTHSNTDVRHCLVMSCLLPSTYTYKTVGGSPVKQAVTAGGLISFILRPPQGGRPAQVSRWYPIQVFDQWDSAIQCRTSAKIMATNSIIDTSNAHDTLWVTAVGFEGDRNDVDTSYGYRVAAYYSSRDGKHWSQDQIIPLDVDTDGDGDFASSAAIVRSSDKLYLATATALIRSEGCLEFNNTPTSLTLDITKRVLSYSSSMSNTRSSNFTLDNRDQVLWNDFFANPGVYTIVTKLGSVQISIEEIDSIGPEQRTGSSSLSQNIQIVTRDRTSWLTDRAESAHAEQWDNQLAALDTFTDINGAADSGLAHTDTVKGVFGTTDNTLVAKPKYSESVGFHTTGSGRVQDGHCATIFVLPTPTSFGGTSAADSPTYGGVVFRAQDKDNLWACWYNYWSGKIELVERNNGIDSIRATFTPTGAFTTRSDAAASVGIRVEFEGATIKIYESTILYSAIGARYNPSYTYTQAKAAKAMLQGYVGVIVCAYSDQDQGEVTDPGPIISIGASEGSWGNIDSFVPTRVWALALNGDFYRGTTVTGTPGWSGFSMPGGIHSNMLANGSIPNASSTTYPGIDAIQDPYNANRVIVLGTNDVAIVDNAWTGTPAWTDTTKFAPSNYNYGYYGGYAGLGAYGRMQPSINVQGYYGWIQYPNASGGNAYYCYTTDYFATVSRTLLGVHDQDKKGSVTIGQFATSVSNMHVWVAVGVTIYSSTNGGASFTTSTFPLTSVSGGCFLQMPYSLPGGGENRSYANLLMINGYTYAGGSAPSIQQFYSVGGVHFTFSMGGSSSQGGGRDHNNLTIDANYIWWFSDQLFHSTDGGVSFSNIGYPALPRALNGWPTNPAYLLLAGGTLHYTINTGSTWTRIDTGGGFSTPNGGWAQAFADFSEVYPSTGVHP